MNRERLVLLGAVLSATATVLGTDKNVHAGTYPQPHLSSAEASDNYVLFGGK